MPVPPPRSGRGDTVEKRRCDSRARPRRIFAFSNLRPQKTAATGPFKRLASTCIFEKNKVYYRLIPGLTEISAHERHMPVHTERMGSHLSADYVLKLDPEKIKEMPMVDLAFEVLKAANTPFYYRDLMNEVAKLRGFTEEQINEVIAQLYTEINIDGRFACVGNNVWGLKRWYPVEKDAESVGGGKGLRIINDDDDDDEDLYTEDEEESFVSDEETYDLFDEDREEIYGEGEDAVDLDDDVVLDDDEPVLDDEDLDVGGDEDLPEDLDDADADDFLFDEDEEER